MTQLKLPYTKRAWVPVSISIYLHNVQNAFEYWANCTGRDACKSTKDKRNKSGDVFFLVFSSFFCVRFVPIQEMNKTTTKTAAGAAEEAQKSFALFSNFALYVRFCVCSTMALGSFFVSFFFHVDFTRCVHCACIDIPFPFVFCSMKYCYAFGYFRFFSIIAFFPLYLLVETFYFVFCVQFGWFSSICLSSLYALKSIDSF